MVTPRDRISPMCDITHMALCRTHLTRIPSTYPTSHHNYRLAVVSTQIVREGLGRRLNAALEIVHFTSRVSKCYV